MEVTCDFMIEDVPAEELGPFSTQCVEQFTARCVQRGMTVTPDSAWVERRDGVTEQTGEGEPVTRSYLRVHLDVTQ